MYTIIASFNVQSFFCIHIHGYIYTWRIFPCPPSWLPLLPLLFPFLPFVPFSTYLAPSSCDRNRPPPSQVVCKQTLFAPPFTQLSHPFQLSRTPTAPRLTTTTLGLFRSCYTEHWLLYLQSCCLQREYWITSRDIFTEDCTINILRTIFPQ